VFVGRISHARQKKARTLFGVRAHFSAMVVLVSPVAVLVGGAGG